MAVVQALYDSFLKPQWPGVEQLGAPIGESNALTKTKSRTEKHNKTTDNDPVLRQELKDAAETFLRNGSSGVREHEVIIHGVRVSAITNSEHLGEFWPKNWYSIPEWREFSSRIPQKPQVQVYALGGVEGQPEAAYYSREFNRVTFFNTSYYGQLKSWVLGAVGRVLADEYGIHSIHGACVEKEGKGVLYIAPTGTGKSTSSYGLMDYSNTRFHSDDWVYVHYAYTKKDTGQKISPFQVLSEDGKVLAKGYRCFDYLENHRDENLTVKALTLDNQEVEISVRNIDFFQPLEAYAYVSEKIFYLRTNLVESFPQSAYSILQTNLENVPAITDITPEFLNEQASLLEANLKAIRASNHEPTKEYFGRLSDEKIKEILVRLIAFDNARAMLDITKVFPHDRVFANPLEPVKLSTVILLKRNFKDDVVIESLSLSRFMERLLIGLTPQGKKEVAYNAYRAVPDSDERDFLDPIIKTSEATGRPLYELYRDAIEKPPSLVEEFTLFDLMHRTCNCLDLNTTLQKVLPDRRTAVRTTMQLIARMMEVDRGSNIQYNLGNYQRFLMAA